MSERLAQYWAGEVMGLERVRIAAALRFPWCWPDVPDLLVTNAPRPAVAPGQALLVSLSDDLRRSAMWCLELTGRRFEPSASFAPAAHDVIELARKQTVSVAPVLWSLTAMQHLRPHASYIAQHGDDVDNLLDGASYGLAIALGMFSQLIDEPLPVDVAAIAALEADGRLRSVGGFFGSPSKLTVLREWGHAVRRLIVARDQKAEVEAAVRDANASFEVVPASTLAEAIAATFPDLDECLAARWRSDRRAARLAAKHVLELTLSSPPEVPRWHGVAHAATLLAGALEAEDPRRYDAEFALAVALRHDGRAPDVPWPADDYFANLPEQERLARLAHHLQAIRDFDPSQLGEPLRAARRWFPRRRTPASSILRGAIGRAVAAVGDISEAVAELEAAFQEWSDNFELHQAGRPLCELVRVRGLQRDGAALAALERGWVRDALAAWGTADQTSAIYLRFELARAWTLVGEPQRARSFLEVGVDPAFVPKHIAGSWDRWRARACSSTDAEVAAELRARMGVEEPASIFTALSRLDAALEGGAPESLVVELIDAIVLLRPGVVAWVLQGHQVESVVDRARALADEFPY